MNKPSDISPEYAVRIARRVTWTGFAVNALLSALKIAAGILGRSSAMVADGIHSLSDFITDIIVIVMVGISRRKANHTYQYGHGKYETFATMIIAMALAVVGVGVFYGGLSDILRAVNGHEPPRPRLIALAMALLSIGSKECLFHYTRRWGERIASGAVIANAWHHRSDAISSIATLVGIAGAMFLGPQWRILDPIAAMIVSVFIVIMAVRIGLPSVKELLEAALPADITETMTSIIADTPGVLTFHHLRSRRNGHAIILDIHIKVDPDITVNEGHHIATRVEQRLRERFGRDMIINTHIEPYRGEQILPDGSCSD